jgi:exodeoxyribonuclease V alpha subunit
MAVGSHLSAIVGGPGTGKTHVIKRIIELSGLQPEEIALCSFTAAAAKRMTASTGRVARTVHKTLCVTKDGNFLYNRTNPLPYRLLVVDEASTLDIPLANSLLRSVPLDCRVVLVGDDDQFPSIGPGNFFSDIIALIPCIRLRRIFRSEPDGLIASECRAIIRHGKTTIRSCNSDLSQCFAKVATSGCEESANKAAEIAAFLIKRKIAEPKEIRIITPFWSEIESVNECKTIADIYPYIPYLCTKNDYKQGVMNGEMGQLKSQKDDAVTFESGTLSKYVGHVRESYAQTSFSSQGNEWECVIFLVGHTPKNKNLDRACAYVSVSRARRCAFVVGDLQAYKEIIARPRSNESRITMLQSMITRPQ